MGPAPSRCMSRRFGLVSSQEDVCQALLDRISRMLSDTGPLASGHVRNLAEAYALIKNPETKGVTLDAVK